MLEILVQLGAAATGAIALWLCYVVAVVLPAHDPQRVGLWTALAIGFALDAVVTLVFVRRGARPGWLPWAVPALSLGAMAFGGCAVGAMLDPTRGAFEGYLLVMGVVIGGQGVCALVYATLTVLRARKVPSART